MARRQSVAFRVDYFTVEPSHDPEWRRAPNSVKREFHKQLVQHILAYKDDELAAGLDRYGVPMVALSRYTIEHRRSAMGPADPHAPPLQPAHSLSRTRSLLDGRAMADHAQFYWRTDPVSGGPWGRILGYHRAGGGRLPSRDVIGLSPQSLASVRMIMHAWWIARKVGPVPYEKAQYQADPIPPFVYRRPEKYQPIYPRLARPSVNRRISEIEVNKAHYTLQGSSAAAIQRMIANKTFSGFRVAPPRAPVVRRTP